MPIKLVRSLQGDPVSIANFYFVANLVDDSSPAGALFASLQWLWHIAELVQFFARITLVQSFRPMRDLLRQSVEKLALGLIAVNLALTFGIFAGFQAQEAIVSATEMSIRATNPGVHAPYLLLFVATRWATIGRISPVLWFLLATGHHLASGRILPYTNPLVFLPALAQVFLVKKTPCRVGSFRFCPGPPTPRCIAA